LSRSDTTLALQAALVAREEGRFAQFHQPAYRARWAEAEDLSQRSVVQRLLVEAGLDGEAALVRAESEEIKDRLERQTEEAIARGVFGVPTLFVGDQMFWGNDRFELVRHYLTRASP
jgi:2-hydroxychromene-2-carboxylate isomerase